jgi:hypothetical protein
MKKHLKSVSVVLCILSSSAYAGLHPCEDFPKSVSTVIGQNIDSITSACNAVPLDLEIISDGSLIVPVWNGGYERDVLMTTTYRIDHYDSCNGNWLWSEDQKGTTAETLLFNVLNPNLIDDAPSYVSSAPMTELEAQEALPDALGRCNALHTGQWPQ